MSEDISLQPHIDPNSQQSWEQFAADQQSTLHPALQNHGLWHLQARGIGAPNNNSPEAHLEAIAGRGHEHVAKEIHSRIGSLSVQAESQTVAETRRGAELDHVGVWKVNQPHVRKVLGDIASASNAAHQKLLESDKRNNTQTAEDHETVWRGTVGLLADYASSSVDNLRSAKAAGTANELDEKRAASSMESFLAATTIERGTEIAHGTMGSSYAMFRREATPAQQRVTNLVESGYASEVMDGVKALVDKHIIAPVEVMDGETFSMEISVVQADSLLTQTTLGASEVAFKKNFDVTSDTFGHAMETDDTLHEQVEAVDVYKIAVANKLTDRSAELAPIVASEILSVSATQSGLAGRLRAVELLAANNNEVLLGDSWNTLVENTRLSRTVGSKYRYNNGNNVELDQLIVSSLVHPDEKVVKLGAALLSDKPDSERQVLGHAVSFLEGVDDSAIDRAVEIATTNEQTALAMRTEIFGGEDTGNEPFNARDLEGAAWDNASDRRLLVMSCDTLNKTVAEIGLSDPLNQILASKLGTVMHTADFGGDGIIRFALDTERTVAVTDTLKAVDGLRLDPAAQEQIINQLSLSSAEGIDTFTTQVAVIIARPDLVSGLAEGGLLADFRLELLAKILSPNTSAALLKNIDALLADKTTLDLISGHDSPVLFLKQPYLKKLIHGGDENLSVSLQAAANQLMEHDDALQALTSENGSLVQYNKLIADAMLDSDSPADTIQKVERYLGDKDVQALLADGQAYAFLKESYIVDAIVNGQPGSSEKLQAIVKDPMTAKLLQTDTIEFRVQRDIQSHFNEWAEAVSGVSEIPDAYLEDYILNRISQSGVNDALIENPVVTMQALRAFAVPPAETAILEAIKKVIDRPTIDKLPSKETRYKAAFGDEQFSNLYGSILETKKADPGATSESIIESLLAVGSLSQELAEKLRSAQPGEADATRQIANLRVLKEQAAARREWLRSDGATSQMVTPHVVVTWENRTDALKDGSADNPSNIMKWVREKAFGRQITQRREAGETGLPSNEELAAYTPLISELAGSYPAKRHDAVPALKKYIELDRSGKLDITNIKPGKVVINKDGRDYTVEVLDKKDPRIFSMGVDTGCCMTLGGASESCIWEALQNPDYGGMVVTYGGRVRAQSVMYLGQSDGEPTLVLDSIEANAGTQMDNMYDVYAKGLTQLMGSGKLNQDVTRIHVGKGFGGVWGEGLERANPVPAPAGIYTDAQNQQLLLKIDKKV